MSDKAFNPFYQRLAEKLGLGAIGKILISFSLGLLFYLPYFSIVGDAALHDWSWLLALLIVCAPLFLYYATTTLLNLFPVWDAHIKGRRSELYLAPLNRYLSDRNFLLAGIFFGCVNLAAGFLFGVPGTGVAASWLCFGYFLAGFVCGMPGMGILGVLATFRSFTRTAELRLDYTAPDRCGGLSFLGNALVKFSVVTLLEGVLIAAYILLNEWSHADNAWVQLVMWLWVVFPFIASLLALIVPAIDLNQMLARYRNQLELDLKAKGSLLRKQIEDTSTEPDQCSNLRTEYDYHCNRREEVHNMRTWPFSTGATTSFVGAFVSNIVVAVELARTFL